MFFSGGECIFCLLDEVGVGIDVNHISRHVWWWGERDFHMDENLCILIQWLDLTEEVFI